MLDAVLDRLTKCLELTSSPHDGEALAAIRKANTIRENLKVVWCDLISPKTAELNADEPEDLAAMFKRIHEFNQPTGKWLDVLTSMESFYRARGYLTAKQRAVIAKFDETAKRNMASAAA